MYIFHDPFKNKSNHKMRPLFQLKPPQRYRTLRSRPKGPPKRTPKFRRPLPFVAVIKELENPNDALNLLQEYQQRGYKHDYPSYSAIIYKLARAQKFEAVDTLLYYIQRNDIRCRESLFDALIQHYGKAQLVEKAIDLFHRIPSFSCERTRQSFNTLLNVLVDNNRLADAKNFFNRSSKMGFRPNSISFNIIIKGCLEKEMENLIRRWIF